MQSRCIIHSIFSESLNKLTNLKYLNVSFTEISEDGYYDLEDGIDEKVMAGFFDSVDSACTHKSLQRWMCVIVVKELNGPFEIAVL